MTRREVYEIAHAMYMMAANAFQAGHISREQLDKALANYEAAKRALNARRTVH